MYSKAVKAPVQKYRLSSDMNSILTKLKSRKKIEANHQRVHSSHADVMTAKALDTQWNRLQQAETMLCAYWNSSTNNGHLSF